MEKIIKKFKKALFSYRKLPDKKPYIEFFTALLTVPVLLTVIIINYNNLAGSKKEENKPAPTQTIIVTTSPQKESDPTPTPVVDEDCKQSIGPISIDSPQENEQVADNPVLIDVNYSDSSYCPVVWSYRINNGRYSDFDDSDIALYNAPNGTIKLDLRVKSLVSNESKTISRSFIYQGNTEDEEPNASNSAN